MLFSHCMSFVRCKRSAVLCCYRAVYFLSLKNYTRHLLYECFGNNAIILAAIGYQRTGVIFFSITILLFNIYFFWEFCSAVAYIPLTVLAVPASVLTVSIKKPISNAFRSWLHFSSS